MRILVVGAGGVGSAVVPIAARRTFFERMVIADYDVARAERAIAPFAGDDRFMAARVDASSRGDVAALCETNEVTHVLNAVDPRFVMPIFDGAFAAGADYLDMAVSLSAPHPSDPFHHPGVLLGAYQFPRHEQWRDAGRLAILGLGMDPGLTDIFAAYAAKHLFDEVDAVHVRDGGDLRIEGYAFAPVFSIWTTIEECLNPPLIWDASRGGHYTTEPFSAPEEFVFPEGIGPVECVNVEHEEVVLVPRGLPGVKVVTFKYALGSDFINVLRVLHAVGLDSSRPVTVKGMQIAPRDLVAAVVPDPALVGERMVGRAIVGSWVLGRKGGRPREVYLYQKTIGEESWANHGLQAVAFQTGFNPVLAMELLARGEWGGAGVFVPEQLDPDPYLAALDRHGIHWAAEEREPGANVPT
jgi:saccharopine dehydrogenase-like NADP-dependent oxidoreductase